MQMQVGVCVTTRLKCALFRLEGGWFTVEERMKNGPQRDALRRGIYEENDKSDVDSDGWGWV